MPDRDNNPVTIPTGNAACPCCSGSTRRPVLPSEEQYKDIMSGYDKATDTMACRNCGGQTMYGKPLGYTKIDPETGLGCEHKYIGRDAGRCYTIYTCRKCGSHYDIDSGD
jgi:hypothetical protein